MSFKGFYLRHLFWCKDWLKGSPIRKQYNEIKYIAEHSSKDGLSLRENALMNILSFAQSNTIFYANYNSMSLKDYPVMNKLSLINNFNSIAVQKDSIPGQKGEIIIQKTSGSTGTPFAIPQDTLKRKRRIAEIKYYGKQLGYYSHEKLIHLRTWNKWQTKSGRQIKNENIIHFDIKRLGEQELEILCHLIQKEKPLSLRGYASTFERIARTAERIKMVPPKELKIIVSTSENLEDSTRTAVKSSLKCEIVSQYANEECGIMAQERIPTKPSDNKMYFNWASYFFEFLKLNSDEPAEYGEIARIVITDLHNYAFPLIRYDTGDTCIIFPPDEFSKGYPVLGKLYGRLFDLTYTTDGTPIYPLTYGRIIKNYECIRQWQFVQLSKEQYELRLSLNRYIQEDILAIKNNLLEILGNSAQIKIKLVDDIPVLTSGKKKPVVNLCRKQS